MRSNVLILISVYMSLSVAQASGDLSVSGTTTTNTLTVSGLDCTANANGGALTTDASGVVSCADDNAGNTLDGAYDEGGPGAGAVITADSGAVTIEGIGGLKLQKNDLLQTPGNPVLIGSLALTGSVSFDADPQSVYVSGRYAYVVDATWGLRVIDVSDPVNPSLAGFLGIGVNPVSVYVSGRYAYVLDQDSNDLKVIDVSNPASPSLSGSRALGATPESVYVSGRYAYVVDSGANELRVIDVSNPFSPSLAGLQAIGGEPRSVYVSGRYAYVVDVDSSDLRVLDVSDPAAPSLAGSLSLGIGGAPTSVYVSGRYAYLVDATFGYFRVIDVSDPATPGFTGGLPIGGLPSSVYVSGRYAYVVDTASHDLKVIDVSGAEVTSLMAHSLEAGNLQVRNDIVAQGQLQVTGGVTVGSGGIFTDGNVGVSGTIAIANDIAPTSSPVNLVQLYAEDVTTSELKVRDEAGNITTLSPHNFSLIGQASEPMAWSFYSENDNGKINVDMLRALRLLEEISGQKLVHTELNGMTNLEASGDTTAKLPKLPGISTLQEKLIHYQKMVGPSIETVKELKSENAMLQAERKALERRLEVLEKRLN